MSSLPGLSRRVRRARAAALRPPPPPHAASRHHVQAGTRSVRRVALAPIRSPSCIARAEAEFAAGQSRARTRAIWSRRASTSIARSTCCWPCPAARERPAPRRPSSIGCSIASARSKCMALREGDGFTEARIRAGGHRRAAERRAIVRRARSRRRRPKKRSPPISRATPHDLPIPLEQQGAVLRRAVPGPPARLHGRTASIAVGAYLPMIQDVFKAEGLPLDLAYVPLVESAFKTNALSRASARGMWQFMLSTGEGTRPAAELVRRRALRSGEGDARGRAVSEDAARACSTATGISRWPATTPVRAASQRAVKRSKTTDYWKLTVDVRATCRARRASTCR